jgi:hypothetical protein
MQTIETDVIKRETIMLLKLFKNLEVSPELVDPFADIRSQRIWKREERLAFYKFSTDH